MKVTRAVVPSLFTVLNMFCGFFSIIHTGQDKIEIAAWLIILGAVFDSLDGVMARITKSSSKFGVEFDSLADLVTFGAAPSFLAYRASLDSFGSAGILISSLPLILGGIRLARFNVQLVGFDKDFFKGLPIPAQAIIISTFVLTFFSESSGLGGWKSYVFLPLIIIVSVLMVSTFKYDTLPKFSAKSVRENPIKFGIFLIAVIIVIATKGEAIFPFFIFYMFTGIIRWFAAAVRNISYHQKQNEDENSEVTSIDV